jgi:phosphatidylglycerol:prolipoprotein diacylglycerol transferase
MMAGIFAILWSFRKRVKVTGMLFFFYLSFIAMERFAIEKIRVNVVHEVLGMKLTQAEIIAVALFVGSMTGLVVLWTRRNK